MFSDFIARNLQLSCASYLKASACLGSLGPRPCLVAVANGDRLVAVSGFVQLSNHISLCDSSTLLHILCPELGGKAIAPIFILNAAWLIACVCMVMGTC